MSWPAVSPVGGKGGAGTGTWKQGRSLSSITQAIIPTKVGQQTCLGKVRARERDVFMPPHLCPCCSSLLNVLPNYYPHLSLCHSLRHRSNVIYTMEFTLTSRMSSSLYELAGTPYLPWVILHCPHLFLCLIPTSTGDTLRAGMSQP